MNERSFPKPPPADAPPLKLSGRGGIPTWEHIYSLTEKARGQTGESMDEFLTDPLHAGLLAPARGIPDHYRIPIPSFGDYLRALPVEAPQA